MKVKTRIPDFHILMQQKGATNFALAEASGCSEHIIRTLRKGEGVTPLLAETVRETLLTRKFNRSNRGRK